MRPEQVHLGHHMPLADELTLKMNYSLGSRAAWATWAGQASSISMPPRQTRTPKTIPPRRAGHDSRCIKMGAGWSTDAAGGLGLSSRCAVHLGRQTWNQSRPVDDTSEHLQMGNPFPEHARRGKGRCRCGRTLAAPLFEALGRWRFKVVERTEHWALM